MEKFELGHGTHDYMEVCWRDLNKNEIGAPWDATDYPFKGMQVDGEFAGAMLKLCSSFDKDVGDDLTRAAEHGIDEYWRPGNQSWRDNGKWIYPVVIGGTEQTKIRIRMIGRRT